MHNRKLPFLWNVTSPDRSHPWHWNVILYWFCAPHLILNFSFTFFDTCNSFEWQISKYGRFPFVYVHRLLWFCTFLVEFQIVLSSLKTLCPCLADRKVLTHWNFNKLNQNILWMPRNHLVNLRWLCSHFAPVEFNSIIYRSHLKIEQSNPSIIGVRWRNLTANATDEATDETLHLQMHFVSIPWIVINLQLN